MRRCCLVEFCPKCKSIMIFIGNKAICRKCGYEKISRRGKRNNKCR
uniref:DNA-directed RNA polymerase II subunit RPB9-like zinc ribbon domain-containing protein n=1 Tax=Geoglobus ahangari TaxID=113653 RepID=A0A7J3TKE9_9EURY